MTNKRIIPLLLLFPTLVAGNAIASVEVEQAKQIAPRIINGEDTKENEWPYMTALVYPNRSAFDGQFCGSTFIGNKYVLTASHCVDQSNRNDLEAIVGIHDLQNDNQGQRVAVKQIYMHETYNSITTANDIAILELTKSLTSPAATLAEATLFSNLAPGEELTVTGWGNQEQDSFAQPIYPNILSSVSIPLVSNSTCKGAGGGYSSIGDDAFCAGLPQGGKDSCQGDSGGPMYVTDGDVVKQLGVVSWGEGCAVAGKYGVYANVSYFADWVKAKTAGISYTQKNNLGFTEKGYYRHSFNIENTTDQELLLDNITLSEGATVKDNGCEQPLAVGASCDVEIGYLVDDIGYGEVKLNVDTNHPLNSNVEMKLHYTALQVADSVLSDLVNIPGARTLVNENPWKPYNSTGLQSGNISDNEWSILAITNLSKGEFSFDVGVSSEENYDKVEILVNGSKFETLTGEDKLSNNTITMPLEKNNIAFIFSKDDTDEGSVGDDRAWIDNIRFDAAEGTTVPWTPIDDNATVPWTPIDDNATVPWTPIDDNATPVDNTDTVPWTPIDDNATPVDNTDTVPWTPIDDNATPVDNTDTVPWTPIDDNATPVDNTDTVPWTPIDDNATPVVDTRPVIEVSTHLVNPPSTPEVPVAPVTGQSFKVLFNLTTLNSETVELRAGDIAKVIFGTPNKRLTEKPFEVRLTREDITRGWVVISGEAPSAGKHTLIKSLANGVTGETIFSATAVEIEVLADKPIKEPVKKPVVRSAGGSMNLALLFGLPLLAFFRRKKQK